jgi:cell division protein FtsA
LRGREPKEITLKNLSKIIHARVVEIVEQVYVEIKNYGHEEQKKKLIAGIVLTGGGSQLKHLKQLVEYITGMDTRIGYPNEHLGKSKVDDVKSPMFATTVGLVLAGFRGLDDREDNYRLKESLKGASGKRGLKTDQIGSDIFGSITKKLKRFITDDISDDSGHY